jgi:hypothetical protein
VTGHPDWKGHCRHCGEYIERGLNGAWRAVALDSPATDYCSRGPDGAHQPGTLAGTRSGDST